MALAAFSFVLAAFACLPALAAPSSPRVVGTATQASGGGSSITVTTSGAINGGDVIMVIAAGELNMQPWQVSCSCGVTAIGTKPATDPANEWRVYQPTGAITQARAMTFATFAGQDIPTGTNFTVNFGGAAGAKAVTIVAVSGAQQYGISPSISGATTDKNFGSGTGTAIGWTCSTNCSIAASLMMVSASVISGGSADTFTEDAAWTFLSQSASGAWPVIRVAYKASGAGGAFTYGLTDGTSRSWVSGALLVQ